MKKVKTLGTLFLSLVLLGVTACLGGKAETQTQLVKVVRGDLTVTVNSSGNIAVSRDAKPSFGTSGKIEKIYVKENDEVKKGQVLAKLDTSALELAVNQAQVSLTQAQLNKQTIEYELKVAQDKKDALELALLKAKIDLKTAKYNLDKAKDVYRWPEVEQTQADVDKARSFLQYALDGLASTSTPAQVTMWTNTVARAQANLDALEAKLKAQLAGYDPEEVAIKKMQVDAAEMGVNQAQKNLDKVIEELAIKELQLKLAQDSVALAQQSLAEAQKRLKEATITAPFDGVIVRVDAEEGNTISAKDNIFYLIDPSQMELTAELDEIDVPKVKLDQEAIITLDALPDAKFTGKVTAIHPVPNVVGGVVMYKIKMRFDVPKDAGIRIGMSASADIITNKRSNILLIPSRAIEEDSQGRKWVKVMIYEQVQKREVVTGSSDEVQTEIVSGLAEGETIVMESRVKPKKGGIFGEG